MRGLRFASAAGQRTLSYFISMMTTSDCFEWNALTGRNAYSTVRTLSSRLNQPIEKCRLPRRGTISKLLPVHHGYHVGSVIERCKPVHARPPRMPLGVRRTTVYLKNHLKDSAIRAPLQGHEAPQHMSYAYLSYNSGHCVDNLWMVRAYR